MRLSIDLRGWRLELTNEPPEQATHVADAGSAPFDVEHPEDVYTEDRESGVYVGDRFG